MFKIEEGPSIKEPQRMKTIFILSKTLAGIWNQTIFQRESNSGGARGFYLNTKVARTMLNYGNVEERKIRKKCIVQKFSKNSKIFDHFSWNMFSCRI